MPNPSQRCTASGDPTESHLGNACRELASLRVSSVAGDNPDFSTIQDAVDQASVEPREVRIEILPGVAPYVGNVVVDRDVNFHLVGRDLGSGPP